MRLGHVYLLVVAIMLTVSVSLAGAVGASLKPVSQVAQVLYHQPASK